MAFLSLIAHLAEEDMADIPFGLPPVAGVIEDFPLAAEPRPPFRFNIVHLLLDLHGSSWGNGSSMSWEYLHRILEASSNLCRIPSRVDRVRARMSRLFKWSCGIKTFSSTASSSARGRSFGCCESWRRMTSWTPTLEHHLSNLMPWMTSLNCASVCSLLDKEMLRTLLNTERQLLATLTISKHALTAPKISSPVAMAKDRSL